MMKPFFSSGGTWLRAAGVVAGIGALLLSASASRAQVLVTGFYNQVGADFFYSFEVSNTSGFDVTLVNVLFPTQEPALVITGESAPPEYLLSYDSGSLVFTGNAVAPFADGTTVGGFTLTSNLLLEPDSVEAFDVDNQRVTATFNSVDATTVPEASTLPLIALAASAFAGTVLVRRRNVARL